ncbi:MAG: hydrogenase nickel incorporation protein HypB [Deltaproteobacteria bacterium]
MCETCGCSEGAEVTMTHLQEGRSPIMMDGLQAHSHPHNHTDSHEHSHHHHEHHNHTHGHIHDEQGRVIPLGTHLLAKNNQLAAENRAWFAEQRICVLNLVSSPGSGKTTLLEKTLSDLQGELPIAVVEGDQATLHDAERIRATGCEVIQINTGTGCHLEADMLRRGVDQLRLQESSLLFVENVGNLVCPALFDLGEWAKVVILSVTEGEGKPLKYPHMFRAAQLMLLNKVDLLPYLQFDLERCLNAALEINPTLKILQVSATTGEGMEEWYDWIRLQQENLPKVASDLS